MPGRLFRGILLLTEVVLLTLWTPASAAMSVVDLNVGKTPFVPSSAINLTAAYSSPTAATPQAGLNQIKHFIFIMQENHSFDSYFGTFPGADGLPSGICVPSPEGGCVAPYHNPSPVNRGGPHDLSNGVGDIDQGKMDGFVDQSYVGVSSNSTLPCPPPQVACAPGHDPRDVMGYHDYHEIPNYWDYASLYVLQDHMFSAVPSYTLPNRLYSLAGQSGGYLSHEQGNPTIYSYPEITTWLSQGRVDWKYYVTSGTQPDTDDGRVVGTGSNLAQNAHAVSNFNPLPGFTSVKNNPAQMKRIVDTTQFYADAKSGQLPEVSWVIPNNAVSEHPPSDIRVGMDYVTGLVNAVMEGPDWDSSAIFISYDEWGGFYDHVAPPKVDASGYGLRVPGLVISPYAKEGFIDHNVYSTGSWLRIIEERFGIRALTARDGDAADMLDSFDFNQTPRPPVILSPTLSGSPYPQRPQTIFDHGQSVTPPLPKLPPSILPPVPGANVPLSASVKPAQTLSTSVKPVQTLSTAVKIAKSPNVKHVASALLNVPKKKPGSN